MLLGFRLKAPVEHRLEQPEESTTYVVKRLSFSETNASNVRIYIRTYIVRQQHFSL